MEIRSRLQLDEALIVNQACVQGPLTGKPETGSCRQANREKAHLRMVAWTIIVTLLLLVRPPEQGRVLNLVELAWRLAPAFGGLVPQAARSRGMEMRG